MFILTKVADLVQITPEDFQKEASQAIEDNLNSKYANKVIQKIGLCVCLYDLLYASEGLIGHGTGLVNVNVEFRLVVFRPFKDEVLLGRISSATPAGLRIRTHFFDEIFVPADKLPEGSHLQDHPACETNLPMLICLYSSHDEQLFVWMTDGQPLYYDNQETVRFRVTEEIWTDQSPVGPSEKEEDGGRKQSPYVLRATMEDAGLGPCLWWDGEEEEEA